MADVYYHGIYSKFDFRNGDNWRSSMTDICNQGILSRRLRGIPEEKTDGVTKFNGLDYISVCERLELSRTEHINQWTAYHSYVYQNVGIIVSGSIDVIVPIVLDRCKSGEREMRLNPDKHYCWMLDDRHVKDQIELKDFVGLFYPYEKKLSMCATGRNEELLREAKEDLKFLRDLLKSCKLNIPIVDSSRDGYLNNLTPVLTYKRSNDELRRFFSDSLSGKVF
jgi:hypothetical protein